MDAITADYGLGDFKDGSSGSNNDYSYDVNGNLTGDLNKAISGITYNHLNLPQVITVTGKGTITYTYDAAGNKLKKVTAETGQPTKTTLYVGGTVFENNVMQFTAHEEGRIRFNPAAGSTPASLSYDYFIKDHLGNVRMVLTDETRQDVYPAATLENVTYNGGTAISVEDDYYNIQTGNIVTKAQIESSENVTVPAYPNHNGNPPPNNNPYSNISANSGRAYKLNATSNAMTDKTGLGITLKIMAGDKVNIYGYSYHKNPPGGYSGPTNPITVLELLNAFAATPLINSKGVTGSQITGQAGFPTTMQGLVGNQPNQNGSRPRAAINWIILDEQFKYVSGGYSALSLLLPDDDHLASHTIPVINVAKNGYIYVYCSNESKYNVFFDNLQVIHTRGPLLEESSFYPFGLVQQGISSKALTNNAENRFKYNGKEEQRKEFSDGSGLEWLDYGARMYDNQVGRFFTQDRFAEKYLYSAPYQYGANNPILNIDVNGDSLTANALKWASNLVTHINSEQNANNKKLAEIRKKYEDGNMSEKSFKKQSAKINEANAELESARGEIAILAASTQMYDVIEETGLKNERGEDAGGMTTFNFDNKNLEILFDSKNFGLGELAHEFKHAFQFETGDLSLIPDRKASQFLRDVYDERDANRRSYYFGSKTMTREGGSPGHTRIENANIARYWHKNFLKDKTKIAFRHGGTTYISE